jgi:FkbM family methyltransferase
VYAFEPDATSYALLVANIARHQLLNVTPLQLGVAGTTGRAAFLAEGTLGSVLSRHSSRATMGTVSDVETITLAEACDRFGVPAFVKMEIEGSEIEVLDSARGLLRGTSIQYALDTDHQIDGKLTTANVEKIFRESGYETLSSDSSGFQTTWARPLAPGAR